MKKIESTSKAVSHHSRILIQERYMTKIWRQVLKEANKKEKASLSKLPLIYPIIYYTGDRAYTYSTDLFDCFASPTQAKQELFKPFKLMDLTKISDDVLKKQKLVAGLLLVQKHIRDRNLKLLLNQMIEEGIWLAILQHDGDYADVLLKYIIDRGEDSAPEEFFERLSEVIPERRENIMTIAQYLEQKGMAKGKIQSLQTVAINLLKAGQPINFVAQMTGLSEAELQELKKTAE